MRKLTGVSLIIFLAALAAFPPCTTDLYLPAMPTLQHYFTASVSQVQLTLSLFFLVFAVGQLLWGPISDRIGRKKVLVISLIIFTIGSLLCVLSKTIYVLVMARMIQAFGASAGPVMAIAIVKDTYSESGRLPQMLGRIISVMLVAPMLAPVLGGFLLYHFNWQSIFYALTIYGIVLFVGSRMFAESYPQHSRKPLAIAQFASASWQQLCHKPFLLLAIAVSANFSVLFAFIASSSFIYIDFYHFTPHMFGFLFAFNAAGLMLGTMTPNLLRKYVAHTTMLYIAAALCLCGVISMIGLVYVFNSVWAMACPCFIITYGVGILYPELTAEGLKHIVHYAGIASSLLGACRFFLAGFIAMLMGFLLSLKALTIQPALLLAAVMLCLVVIVVITMNIYLKVYAQNN